MLRGAERGSVDVKKTSDAPGAGYRAECVRRSNPYPSQAILPPMQSSYDPMQILA